ncbi:MAG: 50S ribosomal protein L11 methyltransferase [Gammaproteobacteria bacterium]|nr:50S ribosomal protein L11 methyltransferase [Gammaproteobacteria bacterium]
MSWIQLHLQLKSQDIDAISDALHDQGAVAVTLRDAKDNPIFEPPPGTTPLWEETQVTGLFDASRDIEAVIASLEQQFGKKTLLNWKQEELEEMDWERAWMDDFAPMQFGKRLWIVPSWHDVPDSEAANIHLDPGLAFGTGTHPTTALCLEWLDAHPPVGQRVIDFGCGSGILAIAALKLGADQVLGTDNDPQALVASGENAIKNHLEEKLELFLPDALPSVQADLLLANILANPLQEMAPKLAQMVRPGGRIVLSGILQEQAQGLREVYAQWFEMADPVHKQDWVRLEGVRK